MQKVVAIVASWFVMFQMEFKKRKMERKWFSSTMSMTDVVIHNNIDLHVSILNFVHAHMISLEKLFHHDVS
jgi:hypothetical protein